MPTSAFAQAHQVCSSCNMLLTLLSADTLFHAALRMARALAFASHALMLQQHAPQRGVSPGQSMQRGRRMSPFYTSVPGERKSKRARKGRAPVPASSRHTLWDLKLRILEALDVHPRNAAVHAWRSGAWQALGPDEATLAGGAPSWLGDPAAGALAHPSQSASRG